MNNPARPLAKELLKNMALKTLAECEPPGRFCQDHNSHTTPNVMLKTLIPQMFGIKLSEQEYQDGMQGVDELQRDGYIMPDPKQNSDYKILTGPGRQLARAELADMRLPSLNINDILSRDDLRNLVRNDYNSSDFQGAIVKAFRHLEELVRSKAGQPPTATGMQLMTAAFRPAGALHHPTASTEAEVDALHQLMRGAIGWFRNPPSHRTVMYRDAHQVAHILAFANLLLDLTDEC